MLLSRKSLKNKKNEKKLKKLHFFVDNVIYIWYINYALDKKGCKNGL